MLTAVAIILGLFAGGLLVVLRRMAHRTRVQRQLLSRQVEEAETATQTARRREAASLAELTDAQARLGTLGDELEMARDQLLDLDEEIEAADALANDQSAELASMAIENEELRRTLASTQLDLLASRHDLEQLQLTQTELTITQDGSAHGGSAHDESTSRSFASTGADAGTLWHLELARSERTWRYSVAILPDDPSPFATTDDALRLAIETEASALRDDVGAFLTVDVEPHLCGDPARALLILRLAQELLAQAARLDEPSHLSVGHAPSGAITLSIRPVEEGDVLRLDLTELSLPESDARKVDASSSPDGVHTITLD